MRIVKKIGLFLLISNISFTCLANDLYADNSDDVKIDYDSKKDHENESNLLFKARLRGLLTEGKQTKLPPPTVAKPVAISNLVHNGFGIDASTSVFFNSYVALELSVGCDMLKVQKSNLSNIAYNYGTGTYSGKAKTLYMIPVTATAQYHIAPFGGIRPYIGAGYHGAYMISKSLFKSKNAAGPVIQAGVDFYAKDDTFITLDLKQYFLTSKIDYSSRLVGARSVSSDAKLNPLVLSIGIGFKF